MTMRRMTRCFPFPPTPHNKFTPNPILKESPTHRHLTFYQMYQCSAVSRNCFPIMSQCAHLHRTFHKSSKTPELSPMGTSAPLLTQPSLTDYLSNYPLWSDHNKGSTVPSSRPSSPSESIPSVKSPQPPPTAPSIKRGRGRLRKKTHQQKAKSNTVAKVRKLKPDTQTESQNRYPETQTTAQIQMGHM